MQWLYGAGMSLSRTVLYVKIVSINNVWNVKLDKDIKVKDAPFHGVLVIMLIILIVSRNGQVKRKLNVLSAKVSGIQLKQPNNEGNDYFHIHYFKLIDSII